MLATSMVKVNTNKLHKALAYLQYHGHDTTYPLEVAEILLATSKNNDTVLAGLLSTIITTTDSSTLSLHLPEITHQFGIKIANIVEGLLKVSTINYLPYNTKQAHKFFDAVLSMPEEVAIGVLLVKLSHLLHNISIFSLNPTIEKSTISALEIMEIYVPLMGRSGIEDIKSELQEICLTILQPDTREYILSHLHATCGKDIKALINKIIDSLHNSLRAAGVQAKIFGRIKTPYSIWLKMLQKNINIGQLYDILAFRIIVDDVEQCYKTLGVIHNYYPIVTGQFQDYISRPKSNGYQSLHTIVIGPTSQTIEIQIRTGAMNEIAQYGKAAHWQYKKKPKIIKEKIYNIYQSLYQTAYLPLVNMLKTQPRDREIKQLIHRIYKLDSYKDLGVIRSTNNRVLFNDSTTNTYQNSLTTLLTLLEPNANSDFNIKLLKASDISSPLNVDDNAAPAIYQLLMNKVKEFYTDSNLLLDPLPIETYISNNSHILINPYYIPQLIMKIEAIQYTTPPSNAGVIEPLTNYGAYRGTSVTLPYKQPDKSIDYDIAPPVLQEPAARIALPNLGNSEELANVPINNHVVDGNINQPDEFGHTPLTIALEYKNREKVEAMLKYHELNPNAGGTFIPANSRTFQNIWPEFLLAVYMGDEEIIQAFLNHPKTNVIQHNQDIETALIIAAQVSNVEAFKLLVEHLNKNWQKLFLNDIEKFKEYINNTDANYKSALYYAIDNYLSGATDSPAIIQALLEWRDPTQAHLISEPEQRMFTTIVLQALEVVSYTLEDPYTRPEEEYEKYGLTEAYIANADNLYKVLDKFRILREIINDIRCSSAPNLVMDPELKSSPTVPHSLQINFAYIIDINDPDKNGNSLLVTAILNEDINTVKCLLKFPEININQITIMPAIWGVRENNHPFLLAVKMGNIEIIQAFLDHPHTDITQKNQDDETALILAVQTLNLTTCQLLVSHFKANWQNIFQNKIEQFKEYINWQDNNNSALSYATDYYLTEIIDSPALIQALLEWEDNQPELLVIAQEQTKYLMTVAAPDEGYVSIEERELLEEGSLSNNEKLATLREIAEEKLGRLSANYGEQKARDHEAEKSQVERERWDTEIAEYKLREDTDIEDPKSQEEDRLSSSPKLAKIRKIAIEQWCALSTNCKAQKAIQEEAEENLAAIENTATELAEYRLKEESVERDQIQNIGEDGTDDPAQLE